MSKAKEKNKRAEHSTVKKATAKKTVQPIQFAWGIIIAIIAFALYANTIGHEYTLDDSGAITENRYVQEGISGIPNLMKVDFWHFSNIHLGYYRPLSLITFAIENEFTKNNPQLSHFINVFIFALSGFLLFIVLSKLFYSFNPVFSFAIALLYVAHPIHTEIVANVKGRDELLSFLNLMAMLWFSLKYIDTKKTIHLVASLIFCYLGMLSKETALTGVALLPLFVYYYTDLNFMECVKKSILPFLVVVLFFIQKKYLLGTLSAVVPTDIVNYPYTQGSIKIPTTLLLFAFCLKLLLLPHPLRYDYSYNQIPAVHMNNIWALLGLLLFFAGVYIAYKEFVKKSVWGFAISLFYITLMPSLAFTILRGGIFAERFLFFPSLAFCIALVYATSLALKTNVNTFENAGDWLKQNMKFVAPLAVIFILYSFKTVNRNTVWKDNLTLFSTDIKTGENSAQNQRHLANQYVYLASNEKDSIKKIEYATNALKAAKQASRIHPKFGEADYLTALVYQLIMPNTDSAIYYYNQAIAHAPGYAIPYYNLGIIYQGMGKNNVASFYYNEAVKYNPEYIEAKAAADNLRKAGFDVYINPLSVTIDTNTKNKDHNYYFNLGNYYASQNDYNSAVSSYLKSIEMNPNNENVYINLGNCYGMLKQYDKGINISLQILAKNPKSKLALKNLAIMYNMTGDANKSNEYMDKLRKIEESESKSLY